MPTAPTRDDVRAYIGTNGTYTDDQIDTALSAEKAAQARVCRVPSDVNSGSDLDLVTIAEPNCGPNSWYGVNAYTEFRTVLCVFSGTVDVTEGFKIADVTNLDAGALVWFAGDENPVDGDVGSPDFVDPLMDVSASNVPQSLEVAAGQTYTVALTAYGAAAYLDSVANFGSLIEAISNPSVQPSAQTAWPADLFEALLRRVQRLLEMRSKPLGYQDTATEFGVSTTRVGPDPEIRRLESPYRKLVLG